MDQRNIIFNPADEDYLTGLYNRRGLNKYYDSFCGENTIHAMYIDVDNFKKVNDVYGHSSGDTLLVRISDLIKNNIADKAFTTRMGGDEFAVIFPSTVGKEELEDIANRMLQGIKKIDFRKDILSIVTLSIGIVMDQRTDQHLDDVLAKCDDAMYQSKYNGKNMVSFYKKSDNDDSTRNIELEMEDALKNKEFVVYYQPKVNMVTSKLYGAEALSRWKLPTGEIRPPMTYIPVFEKNGFISQIDMYVFEEVCIAKQRWINEKYEHVVVSVNMSRLHLFNEDFPDELLEIANKYNVPTNELEIEVTEGIFIKDNSELIRMVDKLKNYGFKVSIDDFGSGFSALNMLKDIPADTIKLDKEFLQVSSENSRGKTIIKNIITLCRDLKLEVVTEGIETKEQADFIMRCGCQIAQGFLYSRPIPENEFRRFADDYLNNPQDNFSFRLNGNLKSECGKMEGTMHGENLKYVQGLFKDSQAVDFPGGKNPTENTIYLPEEAIINDSYTISMWIKPRHNIVWASAIYVKFESGFASIIPLSPDQHSDVRIRDSREVLGWYDLPACQLRENEWAQYIFTYDAQSEKAVSFINGEVVFVYENVPANRFVKWIIVGGDVFQPSFEGTIGEILIYNEAKDFEFVKQLHQSYVSREDFVAFMPDAESRDIVAPS